MNHSNQRSGDHPAENGPPATLLPARSVHHVFARGFSLVELLVVIAVIGILAAVAIPALSNVNENSSVVSAKRQAQNIASVFTSGRAAGAPGFKNLASKEAAMNAVGTGSNGAGVLSSTLFKLPGISATMDDDKPANQQAKHYLTWENGMLSYTDGGSTAAAISYSDWRLDSGYQTESEAINRIATMQAAPENAGLQYEIRHPNYAFEVWIRIPLPN